MYEILQRFTVRYAYPVRFTRSAFRPENEVLRDCLPPVPGRPHRALFVLDAGLAAAAPSLAARIVRYVSAHADRIEPGGTPIVVQGGEPGKSEPEHLERLRAEIRARGLCRHSFIVAVGGGALLDMAGYAAATVHRGIRLIRMPSTVLAQNDAGVGVKNAINDFGRKNFLGAFAPPFAVVNDLELLESLSERDKRAGIAEAVKVALVEDAGFFADLEQDRWELARFEARAMEQMIIRCAELHVRHIGSGGDPFELGSARPLDFGHWSAHCLEEITQGGLRHGEAVAIGMALDARYACHRGLLSLEERDQALSLLADLGLALFHPALLRMDIEAALRSFQEHLGGQLSITLPRGIGHRVEVCEMDTGLVRHCIEELAESHVLSEQNRDCPA